MLAQYGSKPLLDADDIEGSIYIPCPGDYTYKMEEELPDDRIIICVIQNLGNGDRYEWLTEHDLSPWIITLEMVESIIGDVIPVEVELIESERGWGSKVDEVREFDDMDTALDFIKEFNSKNDKEHVPDWYMYAQLKDVQYEKVS